jgi:hypothetical protein
MIKPMLNTPYPLLTQTQYDELCEGAQLVETCQYGPKVFINDDKNQIIKIFHQKQKGFSKQRFLMQHMPFFRFINNAKRLIEQNIVAPNITQIYQYPNPSAFAHVIVYEKIPGKDMYHCLKPDDSTLLQDFIQYWVALHEQGIFFRGMHLGNILKQDAGGFAVIDIEDCYFYPGPVSLLKRARNIAHVLRRKKDRAVLPDVDKVLELYCSVSALHPIKQQLLTRFVKFAIKAT